MSDELPGQRTLDGSATPREILMSDETKIVRVGPNIIDSVLSFDGANTGRTDEIRAGTLMAKITATGKWVPYRRTAVLTTGTFTALPVVDARAFQVGDIISAGADDTLTVTAINYVTNILTIASTAVVAGEIVKLTTGAGSEICRGILKNTVRLQTGIPFESSLVDKRCVILIGGYVDASLILGDLTVARADTASFLKSFTWSDQN